MQHTSAGLDKYIRVTLNAVSWVEVMIKGPRPPFSIPAWKIPRSIFGANLVILDEICDVLLRRQTKFPGILSQMTKWYCRSRPVTSIFNYSRESQYARLVQIWWFQLKSVTSYRVDKVMFAGGRTDIHTHGQTDRQTERKKERQTDRQTDRQDRHTDINEERQTDWQTGRQTDRSRQNITPSAWKPRDKNLLLQKFVYHTDYILWQITVKVYDAISKLLLAKSCSSACVHCCSN